MSRKLSSYACLISCLTVAAFAHAGCTPPSNSEDNGDGAGGRDGSGTSGDDSGASSGSGDATGGEGGSSSDAAGGAGGQGGTEPDGAGGSARGIGGEPGLAGNGGEAGAGGGGVIDSPPGCGLDEADDPVAVSLTAAREPAVPGQRILYTITVGNCTNRAIEGINLLLRVPEGLEFQYVTHAEPDSSYCGNGLCSPNEEATWAIESLAAGSSQTITINPLVLESVGNGDSIAATLRATIPGENPILVTRTVPVYQSPAAELALGSPNDPVVPGETVLLELDVGQVGAASLTNAELRATLPADLVATAISNGGTTDGAQVVWPLGSVGVGATVHRSVTARVRGRAVPGNVLTIRATLTHAGGLVTDNTAELPMTVRAAASPISIAVAATPSPAVPGARVLYTATVANTSSRAIDAVTVMLRQPAGLQHQYTTDAQPDSSYCGNGVCTAGEEALFDLGTLEAGNSRTIAINPAVLAAQVGDGNLISTRFEVRAPGLNTVNLLRTVPVKTNAAAELSLGTAVDPLVPGQSFTYVIDIGRVGASALAGTELRAFLPAGVDVDSISNGGTEVAAREIRWNIGAVPVAGSVRRSVSVTAANDLLPGTTLTARAALTYDGGAELDAAAEHSVSVVAEPLPLTLTTTATPDPGVTGGRILYTTTIENTSARAVDGLTLLFRVPRALQHQYTVDADPDSSYCGNGICTEGEEAVWNLGTLAPGGISVVTVNPALSATLTGGSLVRATQQLTATSLGGTMNVVTTVATENP